MLKEKKSKNKSTRRVGREPNNNKEGCFINTKGENKPKQNNIISFLIGSGFSIPDNLPKVTDINERLSKIKKEEVFIDSDLRAWFCDENSNETNNDINEDERLFIQEFLEFYNINILKGKDFEYEEFYDFYKDYLNLDDREKYKYADEIEKFHNSFTIKNSDILFDPKRNCSDRIRYFNTTFNQLLASLLNKKGEYLRKEEITNYPNYDDFIKFLVTLLSEYSVKVHTLNHDLLFDYLGHNHSELCKQFADGFSIDNSNFYLEIVGKNGQFEEIQLEKFANKYDKKLCLLKLHGSISYRTLFSKRRQTVKVDDIYTVSRFYEKNDKDEKETVLDAIIPDFLTQLGI
jgi:hypothetical protein